MKVLYGSRMARPDLLKINCSLASEVSRWSSTSTERLHRMMCYIEQTKHIGLVGWCGDSPSDLFLEAFADADFASDYNTARSTTGGILFIKGLDTSFVLSCVSKKQGASHTLRPNPRWWH